MLQRQQWAIAVGNPSCRNEDDSKISGLRVPPRMARKTMGPSHVIIGEEKREGRRWGKAVAGAAKRQEWVRPGASEDSVELTSAVVMQATGSCIANPRAVPSVEATNKTHSRLTFVRSNHVRST